MVQIDPSPQSLFEAVSNIAECLNTSDINEKRIFKPLIVAEIQINICVYIYKF